MSNEVNFEIKISDKPFSSRITAIFDKQIYDQWGDEPVSENDFKIQVGSITELYSKLYDATQSNDVINNDSVFLLEGEVFAKMVDGFHLELNENISNKVIDKYRTEETIDFVTKDKIEQVYGSDIEIEGVSLYRNDDIRAYRRDDSSNYIHDENRNRDFKNDDEVKAALDFYLTKEQDSYDIKSLDKTHVLLNGEKYKTLVLDKEVEPETPKAKKRNKFRR